MAVCIYVHIYMQVYTHMYVGETANLVINVTAQPLLPPSITTITKKHNNTKAKTDKHTKICAYSMAKHINYAFISIIAKLVYWFHCIFPKCRCFVVFALTLFVFVYPEQDILSLP